MVGTLPVSARSRMSAQHALEEARLELEEAAEQATPNKEVVKAGVEKATNLLKSAGTTADILKTFVETAEKLAPYVGAATGWLAGLL